MGVIIGDHHDDHHHDHRRPPAYDGRYRRPYALDVSNLLSPAEVVALKYNLSETQAEFLTSRLLPAQHGDLSGLADLGFEKSDLQALYEGQNPSPLPL